jgi:hypothetical protein
MRQLYAAVLIPIAAQEPSKLTKRVPVFMGPNSITGWLDK